MKAARWQKFMWAMLIRAGLCSPALGGIVDDPPVIEV
jgi:hypothetical protein